MSWKQRPRDAVQARAWLNQFASELRHIQSELRDIQKQLLEAFRPAAETTSDPTALWIKPYVTLSPHLVNWFIKAVDAYTLEEPTTRKRRARSMDIALGLERSAGRLRGTQRGRLPTAIHIHYLLLLGETWDEIADRYWIDVRTVQRIYETHLNGIVEHLSGDWLVPLGYDANDRKLIVNKGEAATVRMIFESFAKIGSAAKLVLALKAEGITGRRGKPIDEGYLYELLNNPTYVGDAVHKGMYPGQHKAIINRALWNSVHKILGVSR